MGVGSGLFPPTVSRPAAGELGLLEGFKAGAGEALVSSTAGLGNIGTSGPRAGGLDRLDVKC